MIRIPRRPTARASRRTLLRTGRRLQVLAALCAVASIGAIAYDGLQPTVRPPGAAKSPRTLVLEAGAKVLQSNSPLGPMDIHLVGFHPMKDHPEQQMEAHHFCHQVNEDFAQCVLFDGSGKGANLVGIEFIVSGALFDSLPPEERQLWHPHNAEILSGQLVAPGIPVAAETALMKDKMNSYGKTWHVWHTGGSGRPADTLPLGPAMLAWSFNRDGEADPRLVAGRDRALGISTEARRSQRRELESLARPQVGVDALREAFPRARPIPGVVERQSTPASSPR